MSNSDTRKRIIVAGAGTGKTTFLRNISIERFHNRHVLYLTYTISNANEFKESIVEELGYLPTNITVMTWFSFLLVHGVRPFPAKGFTHRIENLCFNEGHVKPKRGVFRGDKDYYCPKPNMIYRSRLSDLASLCDKQWQGEVTNRICTIYDTILMDEGQDFAGYDYDIIAAMMQKSREMVIVGDPRQQTYRTGNESIHSSVLHVFDFLKRECGYELDTTTLNTSYRCSRDVIDLANSLYPSLPQVFPCSVRGSDEGGKVTRIEKKNFEAWVKSRTKPFTVLRYSKKTKVPDGFRTMNMGDSKGLTLDDVVILPTKDMKSWLNNQSVSLKDETRARLYVAITRARGDLFFVI